MMRNRLLLFITLCAVSLPQLPAVAQTTVDRYKAFEIVLTGSQHENPYLAYRLWAEFNFPGHSFALEGFWDGGTTWKIRAALTQVGKWNYVTHSDDPLLDGKSGTIECTEGGERGFVKQSGRHFYYQDGTPFFRMGDTCWRMFRSKNAAYETHFKPYIDARASQGFNFIMGVIHTVGEPSINEGGSLWYNDSDLDRLQPGYFQWVDKRINYMRKAGIVPGIVLVWADTFDDFYLPPYDRDTFSRFRRYVVARYAAYNVFWIVCGEYSEAMSPGEYDYHAERIRYGNSDPYSGLPDCGDPYGHPLSIHPGGQMSNTQNIDIFSDWLMYCMQLAYGSPSFIHNKLLQDEHHNLPLCNDEFGYEGPTDPKDPYYFFNNQSAEETRRDAWTIVCSGGYFTWGSIYTYTGKELVLRTDKLKTAGAEYMRLLASFINKGVPLTEMRSDQSGVLTGEAYCLSRNDELYMIYFPGAAEATVQLGTDGALYQAFWYDPAAGDSLQMGGISGGRAYALTPPFSRDGLLYAKKLDEHTVAVDLHSFSAEPKRDCVLLQWVCSGSWEIAGFSVERADMPEGPFATLKRFIALRQNSQDEEQQTYTCSDSTAAWDRPNYYRLYTVDLDGEKQLVSTCTARSQAVQSPAQPPDGHLPFSSYPNPFNHSSRITVDLEHETSGELIIYDAGGRCVQVLHRGVFHAGATVFTWDGKNHRGGDMASGVYFCRLTTPLGDRRQKITLVR